MEKNNALRNITRLKKIREYMKTLQKYVKYLLTIFRKNLQYNINLKCHKDTKENMRYRKTG